MNAARNMALSPVSTDSTEWSPITRYQSLTGSENPYSPTLPPSSIRGVTPPTSVHGALHQPDAMGGMGARPPPQAAGIPSPPSSVGRSSDGTAGLYASRMSDANPNMGAGGPGPGGPGGPRKMLVLEETLAEHYRVLKTYLGPYLRDEKGNPRPSRAKDKLTRLSAVQFQELSTDVYDESLRRDEDNKQGGPDAPQNETPKYLLPKTSFHPKRNQARQKLSTLPLERFRQLATDVYYELERRVPRFLGGDISRAESPAMSIASRTSRGPPSRVGTPNGMNGRVGTPNSMNGRVGTPNSMNGMNGMNGMNNMNGNMRGGAGRPPPGPPGGYRNGPGPPPGVFAPGQGNELGRPLPKTFQSNTIVPNKGTMVEDDDDDSAANDDDDDAFNLEDAALRQSQLQANNSLNIAQEKLVADLQTEVSELQAKIGSLQEALQDKDGEIQKKLQDADRLRDTNTASERAEWDELRYSLEEKVEKAETLNSSLRSEIERIQTEHTETERSLRAQIANIELNQGQQSASDSGDGPWRERAEELEQELSEQQHIAEEVRRDAAQFLQEMRELSNQSDAAMAKEQRLSAQVSTLEAELKEWKSRYARAKTQLRTLKASSIGLASLASPDITNYTRDASVHSPDGAVKDVHVTNFQLSIDEMLQVARRADPEQVLESMKHVVKSVRAITGDIDSTPFSQIGSPGSSIHGDGASNPEKHQAKLKSRVSATANNLITASKNHAASVGLSPVSLLDAAASHLSTSVVELVKYVKVRPTPEDELENEEEDDRPMPLKATGYTSYNHYPSNSLNGTGNGNGNENGVVVAGVGHERHRSRGSSGSTGYSTYSSPYSGYDRQSAALNGVIIEKDSAMAEFKNYLDDQTALLVQSIQPLVHLIRSTPVSTPADEQQISDYVQDISGAVQDTVSKTHDAVQDIGSPALQKHAVPVVEVLEDCRQNMLAVDVRDGGRDRIPPLAFRTARAMKELVLRVERIETGELTVDQTLKDDF